MLEFQKPEVLAVGDDERFALPGYRDDIEPLSGEGVLLIGGFYSRTEAEIAFQAKIDVY